MKKLTLHAQLWAAFAFLTLFFLGTGLAFWIQFKAQSGLEESLRRNLSVLTALPRLRDRLRGLDYSTDQFLLTGNPLLLGERQKILSDIRKSQEEILAMLKEENQEELMAGMDDVLDTYLAQQSRWISLKEGGRLLTADAAKIAGRQRPFEALLDQVIALRDASVRELQRKRREALQAAQLTLFLMLGTGLAASALLAFLLSRYVIGPIMAMERHARSWGLGKNWDYSPPAGPSEIQRLAYYIQEMSVRLNLQYSRVQELSQFKTQLVSIVSHEFNNSLNALYTVAALLEESEKRGPSERREQCYHILKANLRMLGIASGNLLHMGRVEAGRLEIRRKKADLVPILQETLKRMEVLLMEKNLTLSTELPEKEAEAEIDPETLTLVMTNLYSNAIKYTPERGKIAVGIVPAPGDPSRLRVYFKDSGIGIAPEDREKVFTGYYRTEEAAAAAKGFGVGLPLSKKIIQAHGSELELESEPGKGSTFSFTLPLA